MMGRGFRKIIQAAAAIIAVMLLCACSADSVEKTNLTVGGAGKGGTYEAYAESLSKLAESDFNIKVKTTAGSAANVRLVQDGFLNAAIVQNDILENAQKGIGIFENEPISENERAYSAVAAVFTEELQIIVRTDSEIESIDDLKGKAISIGEEESGVSGDAKMILDAYGISINDCYVLNLDYSESAAALKDGDIDAFFCIAGTPTEFISRLAEDTDIKLLSIDQAEAKIIKKQFNSFTDCVIPTGAYEGQDEDIQTLGLKAVIIVSNKLENDAVKKLTEDIFSYQDQMGLNIYADFELTADYATSSVPVSFHAGAAEYYKEHGLDVAVNENSGSGIIFGGQND